MYRRLVQITLACAIAGTSPPTASAQQALFTAADAARTTLTARQANLLSHIEAILAAEEVRLVEAHPAALAEATVMFDLAPGTSVTLMHERTEHPPTGTTYFFRGNAASTHAVVVEREGRLTGTVRMRGQLYSVRSLTGSLHTIIRMDESRFVDHPADWEAEEAAAAKRFEDHNEAHKLPEDDPETLASSGPIVQRILVPYTPRAASEVGDIIALIQLAVAETNQGYANSDVRLRLDLAHTYQTPQNESSSFSTTLNRMRDPNDGYHDEIAGLRAQYGADMVGMIVGQNSSLCGRAYRISARRSDEAFQVTAQSCATGYYTFGHEFGHLQGARHNPEADGSTSPFRYGHGYNRTYYGPEQWRTVMAYAPGRRLLHWSNPDIFYNGISTGTASTHDNARVLDETATTIAGFYPDPHVVSIENRTYVNETVFVWAVEEVRAGPAVTVTASADVTYNAYAEAGRIVLLPGFRAQRGSEFRAYVGSDLPNGRIAPRAPDALALSSSTSVRDEDGGTKAKASSESFTDGLDSPYPNPARRGAVVPFEVSERAHVRIEVFDLLGRSVATLSDEDYAAGRHQATLDGSALSTGLYVIRAMVSPSAGPPRYFTQRITLAQ